MRETLHQAVTVARKELGGFFASPAAFLFLGAFLLVTLFVFFWFETFFARNIADVRPLFKWLPLLLIFLVGAITMRSWSEERRAGTLESLLTAPVSTLALVLGKFFAGLALVAIALALTLPLPITVAFLGPLDWGPVIGGYIATLFLAAAYLAIGQTMSARTDNAVVALILSCVVCGVFYLLGSEAATRLVGTRAAEWLSLIGTGSRFESITRGVLDLRDLYYYVSLVGLFLSLSLFTLERIRWAGNPGNAQHRAYGWIFGLAAANFLAANLWLAPVGWARADITHDHRYSLSQATRDALGRAREPLVIRGYFSAQTHPLLAPLVPQLRDLLEEYAVAGGGRVQVEFVNPQEDKAKEEEAAAKYGVQPVPFQVASKYQASVVSSYFDLVVSYGDQFERLGFRDLIEVKGRGDSEFDVALRDPEYAITRAVRKVIAGYQSGASPFAAIGDTVSFKGYVSPNERLPQPLQNLRADLDAVLAELQQESGGKLQTTFIDPDAEGGQVGRELTQRHGFRPQIASLTDPRPFWFYLSFEGKGGMQPVALPAEPGRDKLRAALVAGLQRMGSGALKTVAVVGAEAEGYANLRKVLGENLRLIDTDLANGKVPAEADLLMLLSPTALKERQVFAVDQFLMQGGSVVMLSSPFNTQVTDSIAALEQRSNLEDWLKHYGLSMDQKLVMDPQNAAFPVPVMRYVGGIPVREMRMLAYPPFVDVRAGEGLSADSPITANLQQLTFAWPSPIRVEQDKQAGRTLTVLARSSEQAWLADGRAVMPDFERHPRGGFAPGDKPESATLAVALEGRFESFFKGKNAPAADASAPAAQAGTGDTGVIERSPENARLVLIGANNFASDMTLGILSSGMGTFYGAPLSFLQNVVDWSLEDPSLLALRGRTQFARTLEPLEAEQQQFWEGLNYVLALGGLALVWLARRGLRGAREKRYELILKEAHA